jgi:hypothetical protein
VPLHQQTVLLPTSSSSGQRRRQQQQSRHSSSASLATAAAAAADGSASAAVAGSTTRPEGARPLGDRARGVLAASATHLDRLVLGSARKLGRSIAQDSLVRLFGSAGASLQVGEMRSNFLDFTRVEAVLDIGLNGPEALGQAPAGGKTSSASRVRTRVGASAAKGTKPGSSKGTVRSASPARGMATILGPAAAAAHASAAAQPPLPPSAAYGSSDDSPRSSTIGSSASGVHSQLTAAGAAAASSTAAGPATAALPLASPSVAGVGSSAAGAGSNAGRHKHPAFALDDRGVWHSLTVSATQQLVGPVRLRADARLALDSVHPCPRGTGEQVAQAGEGSQSVATLRQPAVRCDAVTCALWELRLLKRKRVTHRDLATTCCVSAEVARHLQSAALTACRCWGFCSTVSECAGLVQAVHSSVFALQACFSPQHPCSC